MTLTGLGGGALIGSLASSTRSLYTGTRNWSEGAGLALFGGALLLPVGAPVWAVAARRARPKKGHDDPFFAASPEDQVHDEAMMVAGIGLTATGVVGLGMTTGVTIDIGQQRRTTGAAQLGAALMLGLPSAGLVAAGIPLWVKGARPPHESVDGATTLSPDELIPEVTMAPGAVDLTWSF
ncbi:MAG: hypothetical protein JRI68_34290 [Deltaproteobacteria bacterium]|nr:hypothetical protein [Deltaproteobacteria bacterium]